MKLRLADYCKGKLITTQPINVEKYNIPRAQVSYSQTLELMNFTKGVVHTRDHNGLVLTHQPLNVRAPHPLFEDRFVIAVRRYFGAKTVISVFEDDHLSNLHGVEWLEAMMDAMKSADDAFKERHTCSCTLVRASDLTRGNNSLYCRNADLLVMGAVHDSSVVHPNSPRALQVLMDEIYSVAHTYSISINNPNDQQITYYVNIGGTVYPIAAGCEKNQVEDVRIVFKRPDQTQEIIYSGELDNEKLKAVGVFRNYEDAYNYSERYKIEISKMEQDNLRLSKELERIKLESSITNSNIGVGQRQAETELKLEELRAKQQMELMKYQMERDKMFADLEAERRKTQQLEERQRMNDYYERRSYERKDTNEVFKLAPLLLGGGLGLLALLGK